MVITDDKSAPKQSDDVAKPFDYAADVHQGMQLQQDNARPHVANQMTAYLCNANVNIMDNWPAFKPQILAK